MKLSVLLGGYSNMYVRIKRIIDFIMAVILILVTLPIIVVTSIAIKIEDSKSPILFKQLRVGKDEKIFKIYKFRTMKRVLEDEQGLPLSEIERITKVGRILRKTSIDEIPQFFNVLKGEMSFIGPRPLLIDYLPYYNEVQRKRHDVKPGISGWAQVNGRNTLGWEERFELDVWYVEHMSFLLDINITWRTFWHVIVTKIGINHGEQTTMTYFKG